MIPFAAVGLLLVLAGVWHEIQVARGKRPRDGGRP